MKYLFETIKPTRLYIKQCPYCGLKYFGKYTGKNIEIYRGSGTKWSRHLSKHNVEPVHLWNSDWYFDTSIKRFALKFSHMNKIVENNAWANLKIENGIDGGWDHVHNVEIQKIAQENSKKKMIEKYGVGNPSQLPHVKEINKNKIPWNKGKSNVQFHTEKTKNKMSVAASKRVQNTETKDKIKNSIIEHYKNKNISFLFIDENFQEKIPCLKIWCKENNLDYRKVYSYIDKGPVKINTRYDTPTRRWFIRKEIRRF